MKKCVSVTILSLLAVLLTVTCTATESKIVFSSWYAYDNLESIVADFEQSHPDIEVEFMKIGGGDYYDKITTAMIGGAGPDVFMGEAFRLKQWLLQGFVEELGPYVERSKLITFDDFYPQAIDELSYESKLFGLPLEHNIEVMHYNRNMIDEYGLQVPMKYYEDGEWDRETFLQLTRRLTVDKDSDGEIDQYGFGFHPIWWVGTLIRAAGSAYWDWNFTRTRLDEPAAVEAIQWMADLRNEWKVWSPGWFTTTFAEGTTGIVQGGIWVLGEFNKTRSFENGFVPAFIWDMEHKDERFINILSSGLALSKHTRYKKEAWTLIEYLVSEQVQEKLAAISGWVPGNREAAHSDAFIYRDTGEDFVAFLYTVEKMAAPQPEKMGPDPYRILEPALAPVFDGQKSAREVITGLVPKLNAYVEEWRERLESFTR